MRLVEQVEEMNVEVAIGSVLGWFADDTTLPDDIKVAMTKLIRAARLASQEQTPDYEAALAEWQSLHGRQGQVPKATLNVVRLIVDAALVGFHPQPEGDER